MNLEQDEPTQVMPYRRYVTAMHSECSWCRQFGCYAGCCTERLLDEHGLCWKCQKEGLE